MAALLEGRKAIAIDRSPAATFITKNYCTPVDPAETSRRHLRQLTDAVQKEIDWLYGTTVRPMRRRSAITATQFTARYFSVHAA